MSDVGCVHLEYKVPTTINGSLTIGERVGEVLVQDHGETVTDVTVVSPSRWMSLLSRWAPPKTATQIPHTIR